MNERLKKLVFRANHRGLKELDVILGQFAQAHLTELTPEEVGQFERILETPDPQVYAWLMGTEDVPADQDSPVLAKLKAFSLTPIDYTKPK